MLACEQVGLMRTGLSNSHCKVDEEKLNPVLMQRPWLVITTFTISVT